MAVNFEARRFISPAIRAQFRRRISELSALFCALAGLALLLALISYNPHDPSLDTASDLPVKNLAGPVGCDPRGSGAARVWRGRSDPAVGPAGLELSPGNPWRGWLSEDANRPGRLVDAVIGRRTGDGPHHHSRTSVAWPVPAGIGGAAGIVLSKLFVSLSSSILGRIGSGLMMVLTLVLALGSFGFALGFTPGEWRSGGRKAARVAKASVSHSRRGAEAVSSWITPLAAERVGTRAADEAPGRAWVPRRVARAKRTRMMTRR